MTIKSIYTKKGVVFHRNKFCESIPLEDLKRWFRICKDNFHLRKVEFYTDVDKDLEVTKELFSFSKEILELPVYFGTDLNSPLHNIDSIKEFDILGVSLYVKPNFSNCLFEEWLNKVSELNLPLLVNIPLERRVLASLNEKFLDLLKNAKVITLFKKYPFIYPGERNENNEFPKELISEIVFYLSKQNICVNLVGIPFCLLEPTLYPYVLTTYQYPFDPHSFDPYEFEFSQTLYNLRSSKIRKLLEIKLKEKTSFHSGIDYLVLPWILNHPLLYIPVWALHKLTRHIRGRKLPKPLPENSKEIEEYIKEFRERSEKKLGRICASCSLRYICDQGKNVFFDTQFLPEPIKGSLIRDPFFFRKEITPYIDRVEKELIEYYSELPDLKREALKIVSSTKPWKEILPEDYEIENRPTHYMPGGVRWFSFNTGELVSTPLCKTNPPVTISVTFGGGFAELIGFSFGSYTKVLCAMIGDSHTLTLHIEKNGRYVLLRDEELVHPIEFRNLHLVPEYLPSVIEPRISIWNIDGEIVTQGIRLWKPNLELENYSTIGKKVSVLYVCSKYAQRLRASLLSIAHQINIDFSDIEIVVAYIPGLDATEDVLECFELSFPDIRIVRSPFSKSMWKSKGSLINASLPYCSGEWIVLLDADIILPPEFISELLKVPKSKMFVAPDGRKMLPTEITAKILLNQINPWECYTELVNGPGEYRKREAQGIPIGYCQCCRKEIFEEIKYPEFQHFEGADWFFGRSVVDKYGPEYRLENIVLLHLDHGGSQWYGSNKHR